MHGVQRPPPHMRPRPSKVAHICRPWFCNASIGKTTYGKHDRMQYAELFLCTRTCVRHCVGTASILRACSVKYGMMRPDSCFVSSWVKYIT